MLIERPAFCFLIFPKKQKLVCYIRRIPYERNFWRKIFAVIKKIVHYLEMQWPPKILILGNTNSCCVGMRENGVK